MSTSDLCKSNNCVTRVGSTASLRGDAVTAAINAVAIELNFDEYDLNNIAGLRRNSSAKQVFLQENIITRTIRQYGETPFYQSVASLNAYFQRPEIRSLITKESYPNVYERVNADVIFTPIEVADFGYLYQYTPLDLSVQCGILSPKLLNEVEDFYSNGISQGIIGKFCSLMPNIFAAVGQFFTFIDNVEGFINDIKNFAKNIQDTLEGGLKSVLTGLVDRIKKQVLQVVDKVVEKVKGIIENFSLENIANEVKTFVEQKIIGKFHQLKEQAMSFFNELNIENIKKKIEALIDYAGGLFKEPTLEEIQFLIYRFCNLASMIEKGINSLADPLRDFTNNFKDTVETLRSSSNRNTARAVAAGAIRLTPEAREAAIAAARDGTPRTPSGGAGAGGGGNSAPLRVPLGDIRPITDEEFKGVTQWNNGNGDSRVGFTGSVETLEWKWTDTSIESRALLMRVQRRFGRRILVLSGRRSYEEQASLYANDLRRNGGRPSGRVARPGHSQHETGLAFDVTWSGFNRETGRRFLQIAVEEGFTGIGGYPSSSFVHIDNRGTISRWGDTFGVVPGGPVNSNASDEPPSTTAENAQGDTTPTWTEDDANNVEGLREINQSAGGSGEFTGSGLSDGERAYAESQGYLSNTPTFTLADVGDRFDAAGNRIIPAGLNDPNPTFTLADVQGVSPASVFGDVDNRSTSTSGAGAGDLAAADAAARNRNRAFPEAQTGPNGSIRILPELDLDE